MACKYKYNNQWYTKEDIFNLLLKERNINSKGELIKPVISNSKLSKKFEVVDDWNINDDGSSKLIKRFNTKEEANEYIKNIQEFHEAAGFKYGVIETLFANNGIEPRITNETLKESIENVKDKVTNEYKLTLEPITKEQYDNAVKESFAKSNDVIGDFTEDGEIYYVDVTDTLRYRKDSTGYYAEKAVKISKEYTDQALINTKIAKLKEVAKKYPRSLIRSEVKKETNKYGLEREFFGDDLPFQKISKEKQTEILYLKSLEINDKTIEDRIKQCE